MAKVRPFSLSLLLVTYQHRRAQFNTRLALGIGLALLLFAILLGKIIQLQFARADFFSAQAANNALTFEPLPPVRGEILDRNGVVLAENRMQYRLWATPVAGKTWNSDVRALGKLLGMDMAASFDLDAPIRFKRRTALATLNEAQMATFAANALLYPDVKVAAEFVRHYPKGATASHLLGHTAAKDTLTLSDTARRRYEGIDRLGASGVEYEYQDRLAGSPGHMAAVRDAHGRVLRYVSAEPARHGQAVQLTIDARLQRFVELLLSPYKGAAVILNARNGEVLAMASAPSFDNNLALNPRSEAYRALLTDPKTPLFDRSYKGLYPPASLFKPLMGLVGLDTNAIGATKAYFSPPTFQVPKQARIYHDWNPRGHGFIDLSEAIAQSSDVYFYQLAYDLGIDTLHPYLAAFPLGRTTGIDLPNEPAGLLPNRAWKETHRDAPWFPGDTVIFGIGQGFMKVSPLQMALTMSIIANRGFYITPHVSYQAAPSEHYLADTAPAAWDAVIDGMVSAVQDRLGTARHIGRGAPYTLAGKTGTAQRVSLAQDPEKREAQKNNLAEHLRDHSLFGAFAPVENPEVSIFVIIENGGNGGHLAAPLARAMLDFYMANIALQAS